VVPEVSEMIKNRARSNREQREERAVFVSHIEDDLEAVDFNPNVVIIDDKLPQIFKSSSR
jgi:hypothetical protein